MSKGLDKIETEDTVPRLFRVPDPFGRLLAQATGAVRIKARDVMAAAESLPGETT